MSSVAPSRAELLEALEWALRKVSAQSVFFSHAIAERLGMNSTDLDCLDILGHDGPITAGRLAELTGLTTGAITGVINRLERAGYVRREQDPGDRRRVIVHFLPEQAQAIGPHFHSIQQASVELASRYSEEQLALIVDFLSRAQAMAKEETAKLRQPVPGPDGEGGEFVAPLGGATSGQLIVAAGAHQVTIKRDASMQDLCRACFEGPTPSVRVRDGKVSFAYRRFALDWRERAAAVTLNGSIPWHIVLRGGLSRLTADLRELQLRGLDLDGGAGWVVAMLPRPLGRVPLRIFGGVSDVALTRPSGVPVRVRVGGGAANLVIDQQQFGALGGSMSWESPEHQRASNTDTGRYDIDIQGGAGKVTIGTE